MVDMTMTGEHMTNKLRSIKRRLPGLADKPSTRTCLTIILATTGLILLTFGVILTLYRRRQDEYDLDEEDLEDLNNTRDHLAWEDPELLGIDEGTDQ